MNHKAIDAGATAFVKVDVPEYWKTAEDEADSKVYTGREKTVEMVKTILDPVDKMDGDSLPVSAFVSHADGTFELGASALRKARRFRIRPRVARRPMCAVQQLCICLPPHAALRPFALDDNEAKTHRRTRRSCRSRSARARINTALPWLSPRSTAWAAVSA